MLEVRMPVAVPILLTLLSLIRPVAESKCTLTTGELFSLSGLYSWKALTTLVYSWMWTLVFFSEERLGMVSEFILMGILDCFLGPLRLV